MAAVYTLDRNGDVRPPEAWGVTLATLRFVNQDADTLTLTTKAVDSTSDPIFAWQDTIILRRDGVKIFQGVVTQLPSYGNARSEGHKYIISGPWWQLSRVVYQQPRLVSSAGISGPAPVLSSRVILNMGADIYTRITNGFQIVSAVGYAIVVYKVPIIVGTVTLDASPPYQEFRDITVADVIRNVMRWTPDAVAWFDYSGEVPVLNVKKRSELGSTSLDLTGGAVEEYSCGSRDDLKVPGIVFSFEQTLTDAAGVQRVQIIQEAVGDYVGKLGAIIHTFQLQASSTKTPEPIPSGLTSIYWNSVKILQYAGAVNLKESEITFAARVGQRLQLTHGRTEWSTMDGIVQQCEYDFARRTTVVTFGPIDHFGVQDFGTFMAASKSPTPTSSFATSKTDATPAGPNPGPDPTPRPDSSPSPTPPTPDFPTNKSTGKSVELCDGSTICVLTSTNCA